MFGETAVDGVLSIVVVPVTVELLTVLLSAPYTVCDNKLTNKNITSEIEITNFTFQLLYLTMNKQLFLFFE